MEHHLGNKHTKADTLSDDPADVFSMVIALPASEVSQRSRKLMYPQRTVIRRKVLITLHCMLDVREDLAHA